MWHYALFDYDPALGQNIDEWLDELPEDGWQFWCIDGQRSGAWISVEGRRVWRLSLRRWDDN